MDGAESAHWKERYSCTVSVYCINNAHAISNTCIYLIALLRRRRTIPAISGEESKKEDSQDVPDSNFLRKAAIRGSTLKLDCI